MCIRDRTSTSTSTTSVIETKTAATTTATTITINYPTRSAIYTSPRGANIISTESSTGENKDISLSTNITSSKVEREKDGFRGM